MAIDDPIGRDVDIPGGWSALPGQQLAELWGRCCAAPYPRLPEATIDAVGAAQRAGVEHFASAFHRSGDWSCAPRARYFHAWGAAAWVRVSIVADSPYSGAFSPSTTFDGLLRCSLVFGASDVDLSDPASALPIFGASLKVPVFNAPSLNIMLLDHARSAQQTMADTFAQPIATVAPAAGTLRTIGAVRRFAAMEAERRSEAALRAIGAPADQVVTRLSLDRWGALHPTGVRVETPVAPFALQLSHLPAVVADFSRQAEPDLRARLMAMSAAASPGAPLRWAQLQARDAAGALSPLGALSLCSPFVCSAFVDAQLHFKHAIGVMG